MGMSNYWNCLCQMGKLCVLGDLCDRFFCQERQIVVEKLEFVDVVKVFVMLLM